MVIGDSNRAVQAKKRTACSTHFVIIFGLSNIMDQKTPDAEIRFFGFNIRIGANQLK
jgi:hypothetical protein